MARPAKIVNPLDDTPSTPLMSTTLQDYKLELARLKAQTDQIFTQIQAPLLTLRSMVRANKRRKNKDGDRHDK
jgi:hypothetical protein